MSKPKIVVRAEDYFGTPKYYPECEVSRFLCELMNQKCLSKKQLSIAKKAGYEIEQAIKPLNLEE